MIDKDKTVLVEGCPGDNKESLGITEEQLEERRVKTPRRNIGKKVPKGGGKGRRKGPKGVTYFT